MDNYIVINGKKAELTEDQLKALGIELPNERCYCMNVYLVYPDKCDYDEYDAIVVVAENEDRAFEFAKTGKWNRGSYFKKHQGKIHIEEIDLTKEQIILESYNAG